MSDWTYKTDAWLKGADGCWIRESEIVMVREGTPGSVAWTRTGQQIPMKQSADDVIRLITKGKS